MWTRVNIHIDCIRAPMWPAGLVHKLNLIALPAKLTVTVGDLIIFKGSVVPFQRRPKFGCDRDVNFESKTAEWFNLLGAW